MSQLGQYKHTTVAWKKNRNKNLNIDLETPKTYNNTIVQKHVRYILMHGLWFINTNWHAQHEIKCHLLQMCE